MLLATGLCTYVLLKDKTSDESFYVFNTHLDHMGEEAKTKGLELIVKTMQTINNQNFPVFLIGDLNTEPNTERIRWLSRMMIPCRSIATQSTEWPKPTFNGFVLDNPLAKEIDYIFMSQDQHFEILDYQVIIDVRNGRYPSDHFPVMVNVKPKSK
jgi:endonuclease/exonuclease/phosphatase family metal-dependent hydrolase